MYKYMYLQNPLRQIPGPLGLPLLGNALTIRPEIMHLQFYKMAKKYGPIFKVDILHTPFVVLNSTEVALDAMIRSGK